jgi:acetyl esterase/lipase
MLSRRGQRWRVAAGAALAILAASALVSCGGLAFTVANTPALVGDFTRRADLAYGEGPRRGLDVYVPPAARGAPVIVFWYGGAWTRGSKEQYRFVGATLAEAGYVAILPDYRLHPQVVFPAFVDDGAAALRWVYEHAREYGGDPSRIFLMGHSAGAHLAAMLALDGARLDAAGVPRAAVRGLVGLSGPYELTPNSALLETIFAAPFTPADWQPLRFVTPASPPALLLHGTDDRVVIPSHTVRLATALRAAGVGVDLRLVEGRGHADTVAALSTPARGRAPVLEALRAFVAASGPAAAPVSARSGP